MFETLVGGLVRDGSLAKEGMFGLLCGFLYGITSPLVGQPLDTVKTKMQAQVRSQGQAPKKTSFSCVVVTLSFLFSLLFWSHNSFPISLNMPLVEC